MIRYERGILVRRPSHTEQDERMTITLFNVIMGRVLSDGLRDTLLNKTQHLKMNVCREDRQKLASPFRIGNNRARLHSCILHN